jgi:hypothetical protein
VPDVVGHFYGRLELPGRSEIRALAVRSCVAAKSSERSAICRLVTVVALLRSGQGRRHVELENDDRAVKKVPTRNSDREV